MPRNLTIFNKDNRANFEKQFCTIGIVHVNPLI